MIFAPRFVQIGFVEKAHGTKGWLKINIDKNSISPEMEFLFLEQSGQKVPFQIEQLNANASLIKFKSLNNPEMAHGLIHSGIYLVTTETGKTQNRGWKGFTLQDPSRKDVGLIVDLEEIPGNPLLLVEMEKKGTIYVPFHKDLIIDIDEEARCLVYDLPEGLLDL